MRVAGIVADREVSRQNPPQFAGGRWERRRDRWLRSPSPSLERNADNVRYVNSV
jgi:hypothetical protein